MLNLGKRSRLVTAAVVLGGLLFAGKSSAADKPPKPNKTQPNKKAKVTKPKKNAGKGTRGAGKAAAASPYAAQIQALKTTHALLAKANHDYKGHRVQAMQQIDAAVNALQPAGGTTGPKASGPKGLKPMVGPIARRPLPHKAGAPAAKTTGKTAAAKGGLTEPQAKSDAQLKTAISQLQAVQGQLASGGAPTAKALTAINNAITQLNTALTIK